MQIAKVLHAEFANETDAVFAKEQLANAKTPPKTAPNSAAEPDLTVDLTTPAPAATPVLAAGGETVGEMSSPDIVKHAKDSFSDLRRKGKRHI